MWAVGVLALVIVVSGYYMMNGNSFMKKPAYDYQAVFLTNGQVYFGKVAAQDPENVTLKDIYYLQVQQQVQPTGSASSTTTQASTDQNQNVQLVKLGSEIHGPADEMRINRQQVLFVEDLKSDSKVVTAIHNYQKNGSK